MLKNYCDRGGIVNICCDNLCGNWSVLCAGSKLVLAMVARLPGLGSLSGYGGRNVAAKKSEVKIPKV